MRYHHLGIPTSEHRPGEVHIPRLGIHLVPFDTNPYGIEWMRFEPHCAVPDIVRAVPHLAFEVDDLEAALEGEEVIIQPNSPSEGVRVAFILSHGLPVEFLEYEKPAVAR
jgi:hypothetical protein